MLRFIRLTSLVLSLVGGRAARSQSPALSASLRNALAPRLDSARREEIPPALLETKAAEGLSRGADEAVVLRVVAEFHNLLRKARSALGPTTTEAELTAGAAALRAGVSDRALGQLRQRAGARSLVVPLVVLTDLVVRGAVATEAAKSVGEMAHGGVSDTELTSFRARVAADISSGRDPAVALRTHASGLLRDPRPATRIPPLELGVETGAGHSAWFASAGVNVSRLGIRGELSALDAGGGFGNGAIQTSSASAAWAVSRGLSARLSIYHHDLGMAAEESRTVPDTGSCGPTALCAQIFGPTSSIGALVGGVDVARGAWLAGISAGAATEGPAAQWLEGRLIRWVWPSLAVSLAAGGDPRLQVFGRSGTRIGAIIRPFAPWHNANNAGTDAPDRIGRTPDHVGDFGDATFGIRIAGLRAGFLEFRADFTEWNAQPMRQSPHGEWLTSVRIPRGVHRVQIRRDGASWEVPPGLPVAIDEFFGTVAVVVR